MRKKQQSKRFREIKKIHLMAKKVKKERIRISNMIKSGNIKRNGNNN